MSSSDGISTNAAAAGAHMRRMAAAVGRELETTGDALAARIARDMKLMAPKGARSTLANSVRADKTGRFEHFIGPHTDYDRWVEQGRKPGKGLPRFFSPDAASAVAWLEERLVASTRVGPGLKALRRARVGSAKRTAEELDLRARYFAWSRAVKLRGIRAQPFVRPTAEAWREPAARDFAAAIKRGLGVA